MAALIAGLAEQGMVTSERLRSAEQLQIRQLLHFATEAAAITCGRRGASLPRRFELSSQFDDVAAIAKSE
jgi:fructokinase